MSVVTLTPNVAPGPYGLAGTTIILTQMDGTDSYQFLSTGHEVLLVGSTDAVSAHTFTVTSQPDKEGRTANMSFSVAASSYYLTQLFPSYGWALSGYISIPSGLDTHLYVGVLQFQF